MGSDKRNGRNGRNDRSRGGASDPRRRRAGAPWAEELETRRLLANAASVWQATTTNIYDAQNGPIANIGGELINILHEYNNYLTVGSKGTFAPAESDLIEFQGTSVGVDVLGSGNFATTQQAVTSLGLTVTGTSPANLRLSGFIPIAKLPQLAELASVTSVSPLYKPHYDAYPFQGKGDNEAPNTLNVPLNVQAGVVNGTGQKIAVLSDSVSQYAGGLADSVASGDLPSNVQVVQDGTAGETDEGRAMLEQIYDIDPGAQLGFSTTGGSDEQFATNIQTLANDGYKTIVDDVSFNDEPYYQDGIISQTINSVTAAGVTYLSSAGNQSDQGYESQFRAVTATVGTLGSGTYQNFNASGGTSTQLGVVIGAYDAAEAAQDGGPGIGFQFDQAFGHATSDVNAYLLDASGNIVAQGSDNTASTQNPIQFLSTPTGAPIPAGTYTLAIKVLSGANPGHVVLINQTENYNVLFDHSNGSAGGTFYPTTSGHNSGANTISVGAIPFWGAAPYITTATPANEPYSSFGPRVIVFNPNGTPLASTETLQKPDISSTDGNNTSFFIPPAENGLLDTSQPPDPIPSPEYPGNTIDTTGEPATTVNVAQSNPEFPFFTGTSSAAPNLAAVVALMKQINPNVTNAEILSALQSTATPLDGQTKDTYNSQAGYGLANAALALNAVSVLQVNSVTPGEGATITQAPGGITVNFSKAVLLTTLTSANLQVTSPNATVVSGTPVGVDNATTPTSVFFPITIVPKPGLIANGSYTVTVLDLGVRATDGTAPLSNVTTTFNLQQTVAPQVKAAAINGRIITVQFSEPLNPATVNGNTVFLYRVGGVNNSIYTSPPLIFTPPSGEVTTYNAATQTVTIDLTNVPQNILATDHYALFASQFITDAVGNRLNGAFNGTFPSGVFPAVTAGTSFIDDLGVIAVQAPVISSLILNPTTDTGVQGDNDTAVNRPSFIGQVTTVFPATSAGLQVFVQFNGINHAGLALGGLNLAPGFAGRGGVGQYDATAVTDANGRFVINYPAGVSPLPEGQNIIRVLVVGATDAMGAGLSGVFNDTFQVDETSPYVGTLTGASPTSVAENQSIGGLTTLTVSVIDPVNPTSRTSPFAVSPTAPIEALDPSSSNNVANYKLYLITGATTSIDESGFIKSANFVSTSARILSSDPYTGVITLTFGSGLPEGRYVFMVLGPNEGGGPGITDEAGNGITSSAANSATKTAAAFTLDFNLQPTPTFITGYTAYSTNFAGNVYGVQSLPRASYEIPAAGTAQGAPAPPTAFTIDFSNQLAAANYANDVEIVRSANSATSIPDGDFGNLGLTDSSGRVVPVSTASGTYTVVTGYTVALVNQIPTATVGQPGYMNRLLIVFPTSTTLPADYYRVYLPNNVTSNTAITDAYGTQLDGEFLGYQNAAGKFVDQLDDGTVRGSGTFDSPDLSGDGVPGGAFMTGFVVVPNGNVIYARPDAIYNPQLPGTFPTGSQASPYPVLAPEATYTALNGGNLNSSINAGVNFNPTYDRSGLGTFQPSAFYAAQELVRTTQAPVVIVAEPALITRDPVTGVVSQRPFVLQAPAGYQPGDDPTAYDASAAIPALTTLIFAPGSTLKMQNAALLVQNQGSALQILGGPSPSQQVTITSYKDSSVGGATNGDPTSVPAPGDYGGILFRNFNQAGAPNSAGRSTLFPGQIPITGVATSDDRLKGPFTNPGNPSSQLDAVSGADPIMSIINFLTEKYAGGDVPQTYGVAYDGITLQNSRPAILNSTISLAGAGAAVAGLSADVDSLLQDDVADGPLIRGDTFVNNGLNGIYVKAETASGVAEPTNATDLVGTTTGRNYVFNNPYQYIFESRLTIGQELLVETGGGQVMNTTDRVYVNPAMILKFDRGAGVSVATSASINTGDTTYIKEYDAGTANPFLTGFKANSALLSNALFTSLYDDAATTTFTDPNTGVVRTVIPAMPAVVGGSGALQPTTTNVPTAARWGGVFVAAGGIAVLNSTIFRYGGGSINVPAGTASQHVVELGGNAESGAHVSITNDTFVANADVPINMQPDSIMAGDATQPLVSGDPFIHGNVFENNDINGVGVQGGVANQGGPGAGVNLDHSSTWTGGDFTYVVRNTIVLGPLDEGGVKPIPSSTGFLPEPTPSVVLTLQSTLAGTMLADGTRIASPGVPLVIKLLTTNAGTSPVPEAVGAIPGANTAISSDGGAGFIAGADNGVDPTGDPLVDNGVSSQIRILGIAGNQSLNQVRVPVIMTSLYDDSVGTTVNGVVMDQAVTNQGNRVAEPGDGGEILFGANSLTTYDLQDPRSGSIIDNADIKYMTRIEQQGGGVEDLSDTNGDGSITPLDDPYQQRYGIAINGNTSDQYNQPKKLTISDSNLSSFSDDGVVSDPGFDVLGVSTITTTINGVTETFTSVARIAGLRGEPTQLYMVNDSVSNMEGVPVNPTTGADLSNTGQAIGTGRGNGVEIISQTGDDFVAGNGAATSPAMGLIQNTTFYHNNGGIDIFGEAPDAGPADGFSEVAMLAFDDIFDGMTSTTQLAIQGTGQVYGSDSQYNLFYNNVDTDSSGLGTSVGGGQNNLPVGAGIGNSQSIVGNPDFRDPGDGNFNLLAGSAAIDQARSELGPSIFGNMLSPASTINIANLNAIPVRNNTGDTNFGGGFDPVNIRSQDLVTLPGESVTTRLFPDQFVSTLNAVAPGTSVPATAANAATAGTVGTPFFSNNTYSYTPLVGQRDILGNLRAKVATPTTGFGSQNGFDLGAYEFIVQNPPVVTSVAAVSVAGATSNLYVPSGIAGINAYPSQISVGINERLNPATINNGSVQLIGSGGDGVFGNANDITYNLAGRLSFNTTNNTLVINTAGLIPLTALNDEYRLILKGTGSAVLRDNNGLALDGDTNNDTAPLPSGVDDFPGSDFDVIFTIDTNPPSLVAGSFALAPGTFKTAALTAAPSALGVPLVDSSEPTFVGKVTDIFPPANPLQGDQVFIDVSTTGDPNNFNILGAGTGTTDANGNFTIKLSTPIPDSPWTVGADGKEGTADDTGPTLVRVRVVDQAGNVSILPTAPYSQYVSTGAALALEVDTLAPTVTSLTPNSGTLATTNAAGQVVITATFTKNIDPSTLNASSVLVYRAGGSGKFTGLGVPVPINPSSFQITYLGGGKGPTQVSFTLAGASLPNDFYQVILKGTGANPIRDVAGNALNGGASDYTNGPFTVFSATNSRLIYVSNSTANGTSITTDTLGSRENPYPTIAAGLAAADTGDYVLVLPGTYRENILMKGQVKLESADPSSTDTEFTPGNPFDTIIYGNNAATSPTFNTNTGIVTINAVNLPYVPGVDTEISGFAIVNPLIGDNVHGIIDPTSSAIALYNSDVLVDKNYIVNAGIGVNIATTGANALGPRIYSNVIAGNIFGVDISDTGSTTSFASPTQIYNNTIVDNTYGVAQFASSSNVNEGLIFNDIFYNNHDLTTSRNGAGIYSGGANTLVVGYDLFYNNGVSGAPSSNAIGSFVNFNPALLSSKPDLNNNLLGDPAFVAPRDPRPNGDTPPVFFDYADFDLTSRSPAINAAFNAIAPSLDILYRKAVAIAGKGTAGTGPASIGAFYYLGTGGPSTVVVTGQPVSTTIPVTTTGTSVTGHISPTGSVNAFAVDLAGSLPIGTKKMTVVSSSLDPDGTTSGNGAPAQSIVAPTMIEIDFSDKIDPTTLTASDLVLSGTGLSATNPAHATSLAWVDSHTVEFLLDGAFNTTGTVNVKIAAGTIKDTDGVGIDAYSETFKLGSTPVAAAAIGTTVALPVQPTAVAGPVAVHYGKAAKGHSAKAHAAATALAHKKEAAVAKARAAAHAKAEAKKAKAHHAAAKHGKGTK